MLGLIAVVVWCFVPFACAFGYWLGYRSPSDRVAYRRYARRRRAELKVRFRD